MFDGEQFVETTAQPQEVLWAALGTLVFTVYQGVALTHDQGHN